MGVSSRLSTASTRNSSLFLPALLWFLPRILSLMSLKLAFVMELTKMSSLLTTSLLSLSPLSLLLALTLLSMSRAPSMSLFQLEPQFPWRSTVRVSFPSQFLACPLVTSALAPALMMEMSSLLAPVTSFAPPMCLKVIVLSSSQPWLIRSADSLTVTLPEIPGILVDLLASGTYYADATVNYADGSEMTCIYLRVEITGH